MNIVQPGTSSRAILLILLFLIGSFISCDETDTKRDNYRTWSVYGGSKTNLHYSSLTQIDTTNVKDLKMIWEYHTGDKGDKTQIQVNPIVVNGVLYGVSPKLKLFALDAVSGKKRWVYDPITDSIPGQSKNNFQMNICRGITYYSDDNGKGRIFYSVNSRLYCTDAEKGHIIKSFGINGKVDLHEGLGQDVDDLYVASTTPGIIYEDLIIIGTRVAEEAAAAPGHIRAYNVLSGKLEWIFHTIPGPDEAGYDSWDDPQAYKNIGGANSWAGFSLDEKNGILFAPTGSASYDFYGGKRLGDNLYANSVLALDAATGKLLWHYQTVHHDVWDRDLPAAPAVMTVNINGQKKDAIAQITKSGYIFLLDRHSGKPLFPIIERNVPVDTDLYGEKLSATQPTPQLPVPFSRQVVRVSDLNTLVPDSSQEIIKNQLSGYRTGEVFNPPSKEGTIIMPGFDGGGEWGGPAVDPETDVLYINASEMPWILTMVRSQPVTIHGTMLQTGQELYKKNCLSCHGVERQGGGNYPGLTTIKNKYTRESFIDLVSTGRRRMPGFTRLTNQEKEALAVYLLDIESESNHQFIDTIHVKNPYWNMPFVSTGYNKFLTPEGYPAINPPWGTLNAINLNTGQLVWKTTIGDYPEIDNNGKPTGSENYGGPAVTAGGIVFLAATRDGKFRAFNKRTGEILWETQLPAAGYATPSVYQVEGKEYVTIACGGGKLGTPSGDSYVTFGLE